MTLLRKAKSENKSFSDCKEKEWVRDGVTLSDQHAHTEAILCS